MGVQTPGCVDSGSQQARTQRQSTKNLKDTMRRETVSASARELEVSCESCQPLCQLCLAACRALLSCGCSAGREHPEHQRSPAGLRALPLNPCWGHSDNSRPTGAEYRVQNELLCHKIASAPLPYLPGDVTKAFCGQWAKTSLYNDFRKWTNPLGVHEYIHQHTHPSVSVFSLYTVGSSKRAQKWNL